MNIKQVAKYAAIAFFTVWVGKYLMDKSAERAEWEAQYEAKLAQEAAQAKKDTAKDAEAFQRNFLAASDEEITEVLGLCRNAIVDKMREKSVAEPWIINEHSADSHRMAGSALSRATDAERIEDFKQSAKDGNPYLNLVFAVLVSRDSFDGVKRSVKTMRCVLDTESPDGLKIDYVY